MIVSAHQLTYLPWLGYYHRIAASDRHVVLDHVQFEKNSFTNRNKIATRNGPAWLTIPLKTKGRFGDLALCRVETDSAQPWAQKHWRSLEQCYGKAPFFAEHRGFFEKLYARAWPRFCHIARAQNEYVLDALGITTEILYSSEMSLQRAKDELVLELCVRCEADLYLSGALGRQYLHESLFSERGVRVVYQNYRHPTYSQHGRDGFEPKMCILDLLFNHGPDSLEILMFGNVSKRDLIASKGER